MSGQRTYGRSAPPEISPDTLALDTIHEVVTTPEFEGLRFAMHAHTVQHLPEQVWKPRTFIYDSFERWQRDGGRSVVERAEDVARDILAHHQPEPLPPELEREIRRIAREGV